MMGLVGGGSCFLEVVGQVLLGRGSCLSVVGFVRGGDWCLFGVVGCYTSWEGVVHVTGGLVVVQESLGSFGKLF